MSEQIKLQLEIAEKAIEFGRDWKRVSREIKGRYSPKECEHIYLSIAPGKSIEQIIEMLSVQYKNELMIKLGKIELEYSYDTLTRLRCDEKNDEKKQLDEKMEDQDSGQSDEPKRANNAWQKTANMIWQKIADHRAGNLFLKPCRDKEYRKTIRNPIFLDNVKSRIRQKVHKTKKIITCTAEFHRDVMHVLANAVMYNPEDLELYQMALELKQYTDSEMQNFLVLHPQDE
jgi:hypothetical protein